MSWLAYMKKKEILQVIVIVGAVALIFIKTMSLPKPDGAEPVELLDAVRNESSTPRSFVLPATPGLAFEQERQARGRDQQGEVARCLRALIDLGYDVGDGRTTSNVYLVEAVYRFQTSHQLVPTGRLDDETKEVMRCL